MKSSKYGLLTILLLLFLFSCYDFDNPLDPKSENFTGHTDENVENINEALEVNGISLRMKLIIASGSIDTWNRMTLTGYALSETEVTQGDYQAVMGDNQCL